MYIPSMQLIHSSKLSYSNVISLYGCCLWPLNFPSIHLLEIALNKILRKIWHPRSHTAIVEVFSDTDFSISSTLVVIMVYTHLSNLPFVSVTLFLVHGLLQ